MERDEACAMNSQDEVPEVHVMIAVLTDLSTVNLRTVI
jgi:hypothetical protein